MILLQLRKLAVWSNWHRRELRLTAPYISWRRFLLFGAPAPVGGQACCEGQCRASSPGI